MKKLKSTFAGSVILSIFLASTGVANADSGASALPPKDSALKTYYYNLYAPKTQTTYKLLSTPTQPVDRIMQDANNFMIYGGALMGAGTVGTNLVKGLEGMPYAGVGVRAVNTTGGAMLLIGTAQYATYSQFKQGSIVKNNVYFKWTNPDALEYSVKVDSWVEYQGQKVSNVKTTTYNKTL